MFAATDKAPAPGEFKLMTQALLGADEMGFSTAPLIAELLKRIGEDPKREGLVRTPERSERALKFLTSGYTMNVKQIVNGALFSVKYDEMVIVKDIEFFSMCEHHMLPFFGKVHIAYIPNGKVIGLSKMPRLVEVFSRRLQIQERLTTQIGAMRAAADAESTAATRSDEIAVG